VTLALSTSSPLVSVALFDEAGQLVGSAEETAPRAASGTVIRLALTLLGDAGLSSVRRLVVDSGPGSFTGVKVGLAVAKSWAYALGVPVAPVASFDLTGVVGAVALPSKKGEHFYRSASGEVSVVSGLLPEGTVVGESPRAAQAGAYLSVLVYGDAMSLAGFYVAEPSISQAKQAHIMGETFGV